MTVKEFRRLRVGSLVSPYGSSMPYRVRLRLSPKERYPNGTVVAENEDGQVFMTQSPSAVVRWSRR